MLKPSNSTELEKVIDMRFLIVWLILTACIYAYKYVFGKNERRMTRAQIKNVVVSLIISSAIIGALYFLNNLQGI